MQSRPPLSVILPLVDERAAAEQAVSSWLSQRTGDCPFEVVVVDSGRRPALARRIRAMLSDEDRVVACRSENEAVLYNRGASAARGGVLLFTEAHVLAEPGAAAAVVNHFARRPDAAGCLACGDVNRSTLAEVDARLQEWEFPSMRALGVWRCVGLRGFAVRAPVFREVGPFREDYFRFAETALAIHLDARGHAIGFIPDAVVRHVNTASCPELFGAMRTGAEGACAFWEQEPELASRYLGPVPPWAGCPVLLARQARRGCAGVLRTLWKSAGRRGWWGRLRESVGLLLALTPAALLGRPGQRLAARMRTALTALSVMRSLWFRSSRSADHGDEAMKRYLRLRQECARCGVVDFLARRGPRGAAAGRLPGTLTLTDPGEDSLFGFYPPEVWQGNAFRWSRPFALLRLPLAAGDYRVELDVRPTGPWLVREPRLYLNGQLIPPEGVIEADGRVRFDIAARMCRAAPEQWLTLSCQPFLPRHSNPHDSRRLGVALVSLSVEQRAGAVKPARAA